MNKRLLCLAALSLLVSAALFTQTGQTGQDYWIDQDGQFHQIIRWTRANALYYDVELEKRDNTGQWLPLETRRTEDISLELILPPGAYRFRVLTYNVLERLVGTSDWTGLRVYEAKAPAADMPPKIEIPRGDTAFIVSITGDDLVEGAEVYLVSQKKGAVPIPALSLNYSFDETWIRAEFSADGISRGTYDLVITNPGGLAQTVEGVELRFVRAAAGPAGSMGPFDLSNTKSWNLGLLGNLGINVERMGSSGEYFKDSSPVIFGAALNYTFFEKYRSYGTFFWLPNSFFTEFSFTAKNTYVDQYHDGSGTYKEADRTSLTLDLGALYKIRLGRAQRFLFSFGLSAGLGVSFYDAMENPGTINPKDISGTALYFYPAFRTGLSYRITPVWTVDFGAMFGNSLTIAESGELEYGGKPAMINFSLGASYRGFY